MQVLHMMAVENKALHLSHRYHVYVTALSTYYRLISGLSSGASEFQYQRDYDSWHNQYQAHVDKAIRA
jgi:hypothetical protein